MNNSNQVSNSTNKVNYLDSAFGYLLDAGQRSVLFLDTLNKRGNNYYQHIQNRKPPVLTFDYEVIIDGSTLSPPVNFSLARICDRRNGEEKKGKSGREKRHSSSGHSSEKGKKRPIIIVDPRAGHGPGIGGSKRDSEIGMALNQGYPVYFIVFDADPAPGQTFTHVHNTQIAYIEAVIARHPDAERPAIIGNCQAGWAAAMIGADRPDIIGPMIFNGSPLSYWAGVDGKNPMRYRGGLVGGVWAASLWSDLGNGIFDGAHLVSGFENLNPANTLWGKSYHMYSHVDSERERYLDFERWWNGFFMMTREEIHYIIDNLFVGNKLEEGKLELDGRKIDLKNLQAPVLVFASSGDNITPPQQALNWIAKVWGSEEEIKRRQQVIVYLIHDTIGHLGIFVSGKVSKKEHKEIIASIDLIEYLSPGLYEMVIDDQETQGFHAVRFEERGIKDILALDDGVEDEVDFRSVAALSEFNDYFYRTIASPFVRMFVHEGNAELIRQLHPLRMACTAFSDINPMMMPLKFVTPLVEENRKPVSPDNPFVEMEKNAAKWITDSLNLYRDMRDQTQEFWFKTMYGNPWIQSFFKAVPENQEADAVCDPQWLEAVDKGGFAEGVVRIMLKMAHAEESLQRRVLKAYNDVIATDDRLKILKEPEFKKMIRQQSCILVADEEKALKALSTLIPDPKDRAIALRIAEHIAIADQGLTEQEKNVMKTIRQALEFTD